MALRNRCARLSTLVVAAALATTMPGAARAGAAEPLRPVRQTVFAAGGAHFYGSTGDLLLRRPLVDIAGTPTGHGYWLLAGDGGVFSYGDAHFFGSTGGMRLNRPALQMAPTLSGHGYWFVATDGGVFNFGDARFYGSTGAMRLNRPVVGMVPTRTGHGYWLVASDGGVFSFGDAHFVGSIGGNPPASPIVAIAATPTAKGYWLLARDGTVYAFGDARWLGNFTAFAPTGDARDIVAVPGAAGYSAYAILSEAGDVEVLGNGKPAGHDPAAVPDISPGAGQRAVGLAVTPDGTGMWIATSGRAYDDRIVTATGPYTFMHAPWGPCPHFTWYSDPSGAPAGSLGMWSEAFDYLNHATGATFTYGGDLHVGDPVRALPAIVVGWRPLGAGLELGLGGGGPVVRTAMLNLDATPDDAPLGAPKYWTAGGWGPVVLHELGHALGLDHVNAPEVMNPVDLGTATYQDGDLAGLRALVGSSPC